MTEEEWLATSDSRGMVEYVRSRSSERKLRLFTVACCWDNNHPLWEGPASAVAVAVALRFADDSATADEMRAAQAAVYRQLQHNLYGPEPVWDPTYYTCSDDIREDAFGCIFYSSNRGANLDGPNRDDETRQLSLAEYRFQSVLLRDIFGSPFCPVAFDSVWRSEAAVGIARGIYDDRTFERMPILADALQDAGCEHPDILAHCREPGVHVRGCWVVDLVLGKA